MISLPRQDKSIWRESYPTDLKAQTIYPKLSGTVKVDVAVIGAGITGLTTAYLLKRAGYKVAVVDKATVGGGTSGRTTGKVTSQHNLIYEKLLEKHSRKVAAAYGHANQAAVILISKIIAKEKIECDWRWEDSYVFSDDPKTIKEMNLEAKVARGFGLPAEFVRHTPLPFKVRGAVKFNRQGTMNNQKYLLGLAKAIDGQGSYVFEQSAVKAIRDGQTCLVKAGDGEIISKSIVVATNVPCLPLMARVGYCIYEYPVESYIVAGKYSGKLPGMYISPDKNHYSILPVTQNGQKYLLVGGEGHFSGRRVWRRRKFMKLAKYAQTHFGIDKIDFKWSDRDYLAYDLIPRVGKVYPWSKNIYTATAMKKWGLSNGTVAALIISDQIRGRLNPFAFAFKSNRRPI